MRRYHKHMDRAWGRDVGPSLLVLSFVYHSEPVVVLCHIPTHHSPFGPLKEQAVAVL